MDSLSDIVASFPGSPKTFVRARGEPGNKATDIDLVALWKPEVIILSWQTDHACSFGLPG